jgi:hypothetical protein
LGAKSFILTLHSNEPFMLRLRLGAFLAAGIYRVLRPKVLFPEWVSGSHTEVGAKHVGSQSNAVDGLHPA